MNNRERAEFEEDLSDVTEIITDILNDELQRLGMDTNTEEAQTAILDAVSEVMQSITSEVYQEVKEG